MNFTTLKDAAQYRILQDENDYWIEDYWKAAIAVSTRDIESAIAFFRTDCSDEELYWLSEIFEEVVKKTQSRELVETLQERLNKVISDTYSQQNFKSDYMRENVNYTEFVKSIQSEIDYARGQLAGAEA